jgi:inorganic pyrophosphatase
LPNIVNGIIEIPKGTRAKYELDKDSGLLKLDRVLYSSVYYPANYGFIPQSYCDDKDPLDILILSQIDVVPLCIVPAKVIGVMRMLDGGEADDKIIAVAVGDPSVSHINDISELPQHFISELRNFFEDYKKLEHKTVVVEDFLNREIALHILQESFELYKSTFTVK